MTLSSENQIPAFEHEEPASPQPPPVASEAAPNSVLRSKLPDFRPLGTIRDYFTEQMRQDQLR